MGTSVQYFELCPPLRPCIGFSLMSEHMEQRVYMSHYVVSYQKVRQPASHRHVVVSLKKEIVIIIKFQKGSPASFKTLLFSSFTYQVLSAGVRELLSKLYYDFSLSQRHFDVNEEKMILSFFVYFMLLHPSSMMPRHGHNNILPERLCCHL